MCSILEIKGRSHKGMIIPVGCWSYHMKYSLKGSLRFIAAVFKWTQFIVTINIYFMPSQC